MSDEDHKKLKELNWKLKQLTVKGPVTNVTRSDRRRNFLANGSGSVDSLPADNRNAITAVSALKQCVFRSNSAGKLNHNVNTNGSDNGNDNVIVSGSGSAYGSGNGNGNGNANASDNACGNNVSNNATTNHRLVTDTNNNNNHKARGIGDVSINRENIRLPLISRSVQHKLPSKVSNIQLPPLVTPTIDSASPSIDVVDGQAAVSKVAHANKPGQVNKQHNDANQRHSRDPTAAPLMASSTTSGGPFIHPISANVINAQAAHSPDAPTSTSFHDDPDVVASNLNAKPSTPPALSPNGGGQVTINTGDQQAQAMAPNVQIPKVSVQVEGQLTATTPDEDVYSDESDVVTVQASKNNRELENVQEEDETTPTEHLSGDDDTTDNEDNESDDETSRAPLYRSTSLKTTTTDHSKPITPGSKKMVRFADALGLDLTCVKTISQEEIPYVPKSAFKLLRRQVMPMEILPLPPSVIARVPVSGVSCTRVSCDDSGGFAGNDPWPVLVPEFVQPFSFFNFLQRVQQQKVCLESCMVGSLGGQLSADCIIRVLNCSFEKSVLVRHTSDNWITWLDSLASYIPNSCDGLTDKFSVKFYIRSLGRGQRVHFAIRYMAGTTEYWDNNQGANYSLYCKF